MTTDKLNPIVERLIAIEAHVHYGTPPPPDDAVIEPFVCIERDSHVLISAPHGTRTFRNSAKDEEVWHEEDEYTAGMALLLAERCGVSAIANVWRSDICDPNFHCEDQCAYKRAMRRLVEQKKVRWVLDLHGAAQNSEKLGPYLVDLGTRESKQSMQAVHRNKLSDLIISGFSTRAVSVNRFPANRAGTITAFCQDELEIQAIQIEMKPALRVPFRRCDASSFAKEGPFAAAPDDVLKMLGALEAFIDYLKAL